MLNSHFAALTNHVVVSLGQYKIIANEFHILFKLARFWNKLLSLARNLINIEATAPGCPEKVERQVEDL